MNPGAATVHPVRRTTLITCLTCLLLASRAFADDGDTPSLDRLELQGAYAYGAYMAAMLKESAQFNSAGVDIDYFTQGLKDSLNGELRFSREQLTEFYDDWFLYKQEGEGAYLAVQAQKEFDKVARENAAASEQYLLDNAKRDGVMTTPSGLQYMVLQLGRDRNAPTPGLMNSVTVHYHGSLMDGTVFDNSIERGQPGTFQLTQVIMGFGEAMQLMKVGDRFRFFIPPSLAYGSRELSGIPPNAVLIYDVELLAVN